VAASIRMLGMLSCLNGERLLVPIF
jgi:hypothetical protein